MVEIALSEIIAARRRIGVYVDQTPLLPGDGQGVYHKMECWQRTGSFKIRGALNAMSALASSAAGPVVAASAGNHGLGVAQAAKILAKKAIIFVPENVSPAKRQALLAMATELRIGGSDYDDAESAAITYAQRKGYPYVHAFEDPRVIAGQGTVALEILEQLPQARQIVVPVGGGGLISGVALAAKAINPEIQIIGVQSEASPAMYASLHAGRVVETPIATTRADGLAGRFVGELTLQITRTLVDEVILVREESIAAAQLQLLRDHKWVVEGSGAVGLAAALEGKIRLIDPCVLLLSGGNVAELPPAA